MVTPDMTNRQAWYLVYSKPQQERIALENLERQGYETYLPMFKKRVRRGRQFHFRTEPLFPRYLFIHLSDQVDDWGPIRSTIGVMHLVRFGDKAVRVPDDLIDAIQARDNEEGMQEISGRELTVGDKIRFVEGSLSGYEAIYECKTSAERVIVLMDIAGKHTRVAVHESSVEITS